VAAALSLVVLSATSAIAQNVPGTSATPGTPPAAAPAATPDKQDTARPSNWSLHFQQTIIDQWHSAIKAPYSGPYSLQTRESAKLSLTTTLFLGRRLWRGASVYLNPEVAGGSGLSSARGIAGFTNGETFRIGVADPVLYLARLFGRQVFAFGEGTQQVEDGPNQIGGPAPTKFLAINAGKFSIADFFDQNSYSHDPRSQFFNWSLMSAGGWDYPANTRGYTVGAVVEYVTPSFALRAGSTLVPTYANGPKLNYNYSEAHAETVELSHTHTLGGHTGTVRLLGFRNVAPMGDYRAATAANPRLHQDTSAVALFRQTGRTKTGFVINAEQELTNNLGAFLRVSYNDGKYETWAFTEIDRSASLGLSTTGARWQRPNDRFGAAIVVNGISPEHRDYLAGGGYGFIIGDGQLTYAPEAIFETYYSVNFPRQHTTLSPDYQFVLNPAYNRDRGPVHVVGLRLHVAF
jgi:high affinity Mn2+ porin